MMLLRRLARPLLASKFIVAGVQTLRDDKSQAALADTLTPVAKQVPALADTDPHTLAKAYAGIQVGAGVLLAFNRLPRLAALALAATMVPKVIEDRRSGGEFGQRRQLVEDTSTLGALLLASADTSGRPGLGWRTRHGAEHVQAAARRTGRQARLAAKTARVEARSAAHSARAKLPG